MTGRFRDTIDKLEKIADDANDALRVSRIRAYQVNITAFNLLFDQKTAQYLKKRTREEYRKIKSQDKRDYLKREIPYLSNQRR